MSLKDNKRNHERFPLELEAKIVTHGQEGEKALSNICTNNVSAGGALIKTEQSLPLGTNLDVTFSLPLDVLKKNDGDEININISGKVTRLGNQWVVIEFDNSFDISHSGITEDSLKNSPKKRLPK